jgi:hypothetical protein
MRIGRTWVMAGRLGMVADCYLGEERCSLSTTGPPS